MQPLDLWMGTEAALKEFLSKQQSAQLYSSSEDDDDEDTDPSEPDRFQLVGNIAVIDIKGSLINSGESAWHRYFGITSYAFVRNAVVEAANHSSVHTILLNIDSGGGSAAGVADAGYMISEMAKIKPTVAYTNGSMMSAAYWLGASASQIYASPTGSVGSIGVVMVHQDISKMLDEMGVKTTVLRAGDNKARLNPFEPLTSDVRKDTESKLQQMHSLFINHVAAGRGKSPGYVEKLADGSEYLAAQAADVGLIDGVLTFDQLISNLQAQATRDLEARQQQTQNPYRMEANMARKPKLLTPVAAAQLEAGLSPEEVLAAAPEAPEGEAEGAGEQLDTEPVPEPELAADPAPATPAPTVDNAALAFLQGELSARGRQVVELEVKVKELEGKLAAMESTHAAMSDIVRSRITMMQVALTGSSLDLSGQPAEVLLAQHDKVQATFRKTFPVGGVAAPPSADEELPAPKAAPVGDVGKGKIRAVHFR